MAFERIWSNDRLDVVRAVTEPLDNNVYVVRDTRRGLAVMIDAANDGPEVLGAVDEFGVQAVLTTHGHWDHVGGAAALTFRGVRVAIHELDAEAIPTTRERLQHGDVFTFGDARLRIWHTPGHTPGSVCVSVDDTPLLFTGDTLFPGGPGATKFPGGDFETIIRSLRGLFDQFDPGTVVWPGHGAATTLEREAPDLDSWIQRGW